jgi:hypothetical protein
MTVDFRPLGQELSNWGRWRPADQIGTLDLLGAAHMQAAAPEIGGGEVFQLCIPVGKYGPQSGFAGRLNPVHLISMQTGDWDRQGLQVADDWIIMRLHSGTQWDALSHVAYDHQLYNGYPAHQVGALNATQQLAVDAVSDRVAVRGVLLDVAGLHGVETSSYARFIDVAAELTGRPYGGTFCRATNSGHAARTYGIATTHPRMTSLELVKDDSGESASRCRCPWTIDDGVNYE